MQTTSLMKKTLRYGVLCCLGSALLACSSMLPTTKQEIKTPWHTYAEAEAMFAKIVPNKTSLAELNGMGVDPATTPNVALLSHADLLHRLSAMKSYETGFLDPALQKCVSAHQACFAYELEQNVMDRKHVGNFWLDFLNFKKDIDVSGWQFDAIVVISRGMVVYKLWSGKPQIQKSEQERNPLGPLQGISSSALRR